MHQITVQLLPPHLLLMPSVRHALATRTFSTVFTAAKDAGLSYNAIADATGIKAERVSLIARGKANITGIDTIERIADGLHIPGAMLGLAERCWEHGTTEHAHPGEEDSPMQRRQLLRGALAAGVTTSSLAQLAAILAEADQALKPDGPPDLTALQATAEQLSYGYQGRQPTDVLSDLTGEVAALAPMLRHHQPAPIRMTLARTMGQLGGMTAIVLHDLGRHHESYTWFATALRAAEQAGDPSLQAWVLARRAMVPLNWGAPRVAADIAEQARHMAGNADTAASALAAAVAARAYALADRPDDAALAIRDAERIANALPAHDRADTWFGHCAQKHHVHLSHALTALGQTARARESQTIALALSAPSSTLTRTLLRLDAATCNHRDGRTIEACHAAANALADVPVQHRTGLARRRAGTLYRCVPTDLRRTAEARALAQLLE